MGTFSIPTQEIISVIVGLSPDSYIVNLDTDWKIFGMW